jgi:hypothetical protein
MMGSPASPQEQLWLLPQQILRHHKHHIMAA